ncbi:MAG: PAS domain S-box protein, partial [Chloroflexota bacterium]
MDFGAMSEMSLRILLIEDNPGDARLVIEAFSDLAEGQTVSLFHATTVTHGLAILAEMPLDAILLDLTLPDSSGLATLQRIYSLARQVPIILLTGTQDEETAKAAMRSGAQDYLVKGEVDGRLLMRSIRYAIERKISEDSLRASEERYRILIEQASDGFFITDPDGKFLDVNSNGCLMLGYTRDELLEMNMREVVVTGLGASMRGQWSELVNGTTIIVEHELTRRDGTVIPVEISAKMLQDGRRQGIVRDIRARKLAEAALRESNDFNEMLIKTLPFLMDIVDENGIVLYVNPKMEATGREEILGHRCWEINRTDQTHCHDCPLRLEIEIGKTNSLEVSGMRNGKIYNVTHTGMWYKGRKALMEVFQDMTERKQ